MAPQEKDSARILVRNALKYQGFGGCETIVRINALDTEHWRRDLDEIVPMRPNFIMPPKTGCAGDILELDAYLTQLEKKLGFAPNTVRIIALIETALAWKMLTTLPAPALAWRALFLGGEDLDGGFALSADQGWRGNPLC